MQEKQLKLIRILLKSNRPVTSKQLASMLEISSRTVINYINSLNVTYETPVITATQEGYSIDRENAQKLLNTVSKIPDGYKERAFFICKRLLLEQDKSADAFDLSDEMYISYSLLKSDLTKMNQAFAYLNVKFVTKNNIVQIVGNEKDKRKLMNHVLHEIQETNIFDISTLKKYFPVETVDTSLEVLEKVHQQYGYYLNDFAKLNILLHIVTMVCRIYGGNFMQQDVTKENNFTPPNDNEYELAQKIQLELENKFNIKMQTEDSVQLYLMMKSCSTITERESEKVISHYVGEEYLEQIKKIIATTEEAYCIRLNTNDFFMRFALHINSLLVRSETDMRLENPMKDTLRNSLPFLYDVAIFIIMQLQNVSLLRKSLSEDEIAFIVLHLGAEIERQNESENAIKCALLIPNYLDVSQTIAQKLLYRFGDRIMLTQISSLEKSSTQHSFDLIISTFDKSLDTSDECVYVSPFLSTTDYIAIDNAIDRVQLKKSQNYLKSNFDYYFSEENFLVRNALGRDDAINTLCDLLIKNNYVNDEFRANVFKREKAISTAYPDFAIPHSVSADANVNTIAVLVSEDGIKWDEHTVYVVFLMAISPDSLNIFQELYQILAQILMDTSVVKSMRACKSFDDLKKILLNSWLY